jgi:hypothetical protein
MPLQTIEFKPGIDKESTDYAAKGGWVDGNLIRFRKGRVEKVGGWNKLGTSYFLGIARALHSWISLGGTRFLGLGTTFKYYIEEGESYNDVTPIRATTAAGDVTFSATDGSSTITVTDTAHGAVSNDFVTFSDAVTLGGNITAEVLNQEYQISLVTSLNAYEIVAKDTSGNEVTANSSDTGNGGSAVVGEYQINVGLDTFVNSSGWGVGTWGAGGWGSSTAITPEAAVSIAGWRMTVLRHAQLSFREYQAQISCQQWLCRSSPQKLIGTLFAWVLTLFLAGLAQTSSTQCSWPSLTQRTS